MSSQTYSKILSKLNELPQNHRKFLLDKINKVRLDRDGLGGWIERHTTEWPVPWHLQRLVNLFERAAKSQVFAVVSMPPRHGKTTSARNAIAWLTERYHDRLNGLVMYSADMAKRQSVKIRKLVASRGVALSEDNQRQNYWVTRHGGGLASSGIESGLTGEGFGGILVCDDLLRGRQQADSLSERDKAWDTFRHDAFTRLQPPAGSCIAIATRWHEDDVIGRILSESGKDNFPVFENICLPAVRDEYGNPSDDMDHGIPLWPDRFPLDKLRTIRAVVQEYGWASLYQGQPRPRSGRVFGEPARYESISLFGARIVLACDPAGTERSYSDYTAAVALAVRGFGEQMTADVIDVFREQLEPQRAARKLREWQLRHGGGSLVVEGSRDGKSLIKALREIEPSLLINEVKPTGSKFARAQPLAEAWNAGRVRVPVRAPWLQAFLEEVAKFSGVSDKHDDQVDAAAYAWHQAVGKRHLSVELLNVG